MARAPIPGAARHHETARFVWRLTVRGQVITAPTPAGLPIGEKVRVRAETGMPYEAFLQPGTNQFGEDTLVVLWWVGRRLAGETISFEKAADEWQALDLTDDDLGVEFVDLHEEDAIDHPEGSGPSS